MIWVSPLDTGFMVRFKFKSPYIASKTTTRDADFFSEQDNAFFILISPDIKHPSEIYGFAVNPKGTQSDFKITVDAQSYDWDANWYSRITTARNMWSGEIFIPYSITQNWSDTVGMCFIRLTYDSTGQKRYLVTGLNGRILKVEDFTKIRIKKPNPHPSIEFIPYTVFNGNWFTSYITSGINMKFKYKHSNLNFVYNPDYAEIEADKSEFDLYHTGVFLPEKRPFFKNISDLVNINVPYGKLFYSRSFRDIDYALAFKHQYFRHILLFMGIKSDSSMYGLLRWKYYYSYRKKLYLNPGMGIIQSNLNDRILYTHQNIKYIIHSEYYFNSDLKYALGAGSNAKFYSVSGALGKGTGKTIFGFETNFAHIGDLDLSKGLLYFKNVNTLKSVMHGTFFTGSNFLNRISAYGSFEKMNEIYTGDLIFKDLYYRLNFNILSKFYLILTSEKNRRRYNKTVYNNHEKSIGTHLNLQNMNTEMDIKYSVGNLWGRDINKIGFEISGAYKDLSYEFSHFVFSYCERLCPEVFFTPFRGNTMFQFDFRVSYRLKKINFLRIFLERETFENSNTLNLMYERELPDVNSTFYIVINSKYDATSRYFNLPAKNDFRWAIKLSYAIKI